MSLEIRSDKAHCKSRARPNRARLVCRRLGPSLRLASLRARTFAEGSRRVCLAKCVIGGLWSRGPKPTFSNDSVDLWPCRQRRQGEQTTPCPSKFGFGSPGLQKNTCQKTLRDTSELFCGQGLRTQLRGLKRDILKHNLAAFFCEGVFADVERVPRLRLHTMAD